MIGVPLSWAAQYMSAPYNIKTGYVAPYTTTELPKNRIFIKNSWLPEIYDQNKQLQLYLIFMQTCYTFWYSWDMLENLQHA